LVTADETSEMTMPTAKSCDMSLGSKRLCRHRPARCVQPSALALKPSTNSWHAGVSSSLLDPALIPVELLV